MLEFLFWKDEAVKTILFYKLIVILKNLSKHYFMHSMIVICKKFKLNKD